MRYPVLGATLQRRGGVARHDTVAWGYRPRRRRARRRHHPELRGDRRSARDGGRVAGVETTRGTIGAGKVAIVRGRPHLGARGDGRASGCRSQSHPLQALVSEPVKPVLDCVVMSNAVHVYVSQARQGRAGDGRRHRRLQLLRPARLVPRHRAADGGAARAVPDLLARARCCAPGPASSTSAPDASPIIGKLPVDGLYLNCGWGTGGFKATPGVGWVFAHTIAHDEPHPLNAPFALDRFTTGALIDEHGAAAVAH